MNNKKDLEIIYNKLREFYNNNSIKTIIENKCTINNINKKKNIELSVVFTTNNRSKQTYFTLKSWEHIGKLNNINIQVVIVEDSLNDKLDISKLKYDNLEITYIYVKNKTWINPCLNYNIGFEFIEADKVVITNAEVCVFGNIYEEIKNNLNDSNYLVFDVFEMGKGHCEINLNKDIWEKCSDFNYKTINNYKKNKDIFWLQSENNNRNFHFLTCISNNNLKKIKGFDLDLSLNIDYDDNLFLEKIKLFLKLKIVNIFYNNNLVGLHQWHTKHSHNYYINNDVRKFNKLLYDLKIKYIKIKNKNLQLKDFDTIQDLFNEIKDII